jgi:hypothetical protein
MSPPTDSRPPSGGTRTVMPDAHRRHDDPEDTPLPERARPWTWEAIVALLALAFSAMGTLAAVSGIAYLTLYRVGDLDKWRADHTAEVKSAAEKLDARFDKADIRVAQLEAEERGTKEGQGTRLTQLEDHYAAILTTLADIEKKLDVDARHR